MACENCNIEKAVLIRPASKSKLCKNCFTSMVEDEVHDTIIKNKIFTRNEDVAIAISGGKDSTVLAHILNTLNKKYDYGINIYLLSVDEGIKNYRDFSLQTVKENQKEYNLPLKIVSYEEYFNLSMDEVVKKIGRKGNCTYCGVFRRQALERGSKELGVSQIITGHNADDMAETVLMNLLRGDHKRLKRCTLIKTTASESSLSRSKPFKYIFEKEIVMYAFYKNLNYFSVECTYSPGAYRGHVRLFVKELERKNPKLILDIIKSGEEFEKKDENIQLFSCPKCGEITAKEYRICKACELISGLTKINLEEI